MRLFFGEANGGKVVLDVDPNSSLDDVKNVLMKEHQFCDGNYIFIYNGKFLPLNGAFKHMKENSSVIIYIKNKLAYGAKKYTAEDFWANPLLAQQWAEIADRNDSHTMALISNIEISLPAINDASLLAGILPLVQNNAITSDFDAEYSQLSRQQRNDFQRVLTLSGCPDRDVALQTFIACNHDINTTVNCLM